MLYMAFYVLCGTYMSQRSLLNWLNELYCFFFFFFSILIHSIQETSIPEGVIMEIFSYLLDTIPVPAIYFC